MKEIEAKFLDINYKEIIKKLKLNGGKRVHKLMFYKRYVFNLFDHQLKNTNGGYIRVRQENNKVTMTIKTYSNESKYANEDEIILSSSLEQAKNFLLAQGYKLKHYHETIREKWSLKNCKEIAIDFIPGIPTYIELECNNEKSIKIVAKLLDLDIKKAEYEPYYKQYYDYYGIKKDDFHNIPNLSFSNIDKILNKYVTKNKDLIKQIKNDQIKIINKINK